MKKFKKAALVIGFVSALAGTSCSTLQTEEGSARVPAASDEVGAAKAQGADEVSCYDSVNCRESTRSKFHKY